MWLSATGADPNGDALAYAWDLDNNGTYETPGQTVAFSAASIDGPATRTVGVRVSDGRRRRPTPRGDDHEPAADGNVHRAGDGRRGQPVHAGAHGPESTRRPPTRSRLLIRVRLRLGLRAFGAAPTRSCPTSNVGMLSVGGKIRDKDGGVTEYRGVRRQSVVTVASLCGALERFVTKEGVAHSMS